MKHVVFLDESSGTAAMAAALFGAMVHPELVRGTWGCPSGAREVPRDVKEALAEIGFLSTLSEPAAQDALPTADRVVVVSRVGEPRALPEVRRDDWHLPALSNFSGPDLRKFRDSLRTRVWRMVAREGWYRLQPRTSGSVRRAARSGVVRSPARNVIPFEVSSAPKSCPTCGRAVPRPAAKNLYVHAVRLGQAGVLSLDEVLCMSCLEGMPAPERAEWLPLLEVATD
jgi:hypothetical protein